MALNGHGHRAVAKELSGAQQSRNARDLIVHTTPRLATVRQEELLLATVAVPLKHETTSLANAYAGDA